MANNTKTSHMPKAESKAVSMEKYLRVLEDFHRVSTKLERTIDQFQKEYEYAEEQLRLVNLMNEFIESDKEIKKKYKEYLKIDPKDKK